MQTQKNLADASVDDSDSNGTSALMMASLHGHAEAVATLLSHSADVNAETAQHRTALLMAAHGGKASVCELLLGSGAPLALPCDCDSTTIVVKEVRF